MPDPEVLLAGGPWRGLSRVVQKATLTPSESPDCTDCRNVDRKRGLLGPRLGRQRVTTHTYNLLGLGMLNSPFGRYKVTADANGDWIASAVTWAGVAPPSPTINTITKMALTSNVATVTIPRHGFRVGQTVNFTLASGTDYADFNNDTFTIATVPTINTFTFAFTHADIGFNDTAGTVTSDYLSAMSTSATARFVQFKDRLYGCDGKDRNQAFDGVRWWPQGILGGIDLPQFTPTVAVSGGATVQVTTASLTSHVATLTTSTPHGFSVGQIVTVSISDDIFSGGAPSANYTITVVPTSTTFKYALTHADVASESVFGTAAVAPSTAIYLKTIQQTTTTVTVVTVASHGLANGNTVKFAGATDPVSSYFNGIVTGAITVTAADTFTFDSSAVTSGTWPWGTYPTYTWPAAFRPYITAVGASTVITGTYYYAVAAANSKRTNAYGRMIEGNPSRVSAVASPNNQTVTLGAIPSSHPDSQVDQWNVYRTLNGGFDTGIVPEQQDFFYLGFVAMGTTTYTDTTSDSSGWYLVDDNSNRLRWGQNIPPTCKYMVEYADRLFCAGFDPITSSTVTVANGNATATLATGTWPDGVKGCFMRFAGEQERYEIKARPSTTTVTLDRVYEGTQTSGTHYTIFRNEDEVWFSEENDGDAFGKDGEQRRNLRKFPGEGKVTGLAKFQGALVVFMATEIWAIYGRGANRFDIKKMVDASCVDAGCVSHDTINRVGNDLHFLSLDGPASISSAGTSISVELYGIPLNVDWLDGLTSTELALSCSGTDGRAVWYSVPVSGQVQNSKTFRYERDDGSWWEELGCNPKKFIRQDGTDGQLQMLFYLQGKSIIHPASGSLDLVSAGINVATAAYTPTTTTLTKTGAFTGLNLVECYVRFYLGGTPTNQLGTLVATRRIISNTNDAITWSSDATLPGSGTVATNAYDEYEIGNIPWVWTTRTQETPGHLALIDELDVTFEEAS